MRYEGSLEGGGSSEGSLSLWSVTGEEPSTPSGFGKIWM